MNRFMKKHLPLLLALLAMPAGAGDIAIINGTVHTVSDAGVIEKGTVLIRDDRIIAVGADVAVPDDAVVIDANGRIVTPGLVEPASQLGLTEVGAVDGTNDWTSLDDRFTASHAVADAINPRSSLIPIQRMEGVTRAVSVPAVSYDGGQLISGRSAAISLGSVSDFIVREHAGMHAAFGETAAQLAGGSRGVAMLKLREALDDARDFARNRDAFMAADRYAYALSRLDLEALQPVLAGDMPFVVGVERASDIEAILRLAADYQLKLVISGGSEAWMVADQLAAANVPVIVDAYQNLPSSFESLGSTLENAARLHAAGVTVVFSAGAGTGPSGTHNARNITQYAGNAVAHGLDYDAALAAITANPAAIYGLSDVGRLAAGYRADVVIWDGDPLEVTSFPDAVLIDGEMMPMTSRQQLLRDRYRDDEDWPQAYDKP
ncbi:MAG: amidohydrolase family protein [Gammaproteobacteria bacterium]|nr:amidohydrolase family protein [Gammaproteobacteria bacterium]